MYLFYYKILKYVHKLGLPVKFPDAFIALLHLFLVQDTSKKEQNILTTKNRLRIMVKSQFSINPLKS